MEESAQVENEHLQRIQNSVDETGFKADVRTVTAETELKLADGAFEGVSTVGEFVRKTAEEALTGSAGSEPVASLDSYRMVNDRKSRKSA